MASELFARHFLGVCLARIGSPVDPWLGIIPWLYQPPVLLLGVGLLLASFARSRNPTFLAIIMGQAGFFLALPSVFSLVCLVAGILVLRQQAKAEEAALERLHGEAYRRYRQDVPRWL